MHLQNHSTVLFNTIMIFSGHYLCCSTVNLFVGFRRDASLVRILLQYNWNWLKVCSMQAILSFLALSGFREGKTINWTKKENVTDWRFDKSEKQIANHGQVRLRLRWTNLTLVEARKWSSSHCCTLKHFKINWSELF